MTVEDLIDAMALNKHILKNNREREFIVSVKSYVEKYNRITKPQSNYALSIAVKYKKEFYKNGIYIHDITRLVEKPEYRTNIHVPAANNYIKYVGNDIVFLKFGFSDELSRKLKEVVSNTNYFNPTNTLKFIKEERGWLLRITKDNLDKFIKFIKEAKLDFEPRLIEIFKAIQDADNNIELEEDEDTITIYSNNDYILNDLLGDVHDD